MNQNFDKDENRTALHWSVVYLIFDKSGVQLVSRSWDNCQINWHQRQDETEKLQKIFIFGLLFNVLDKLNGFLKIGENLVGHM